ncbi:MAG: hypothetical protein GY714_20320 [Desulfobacterales bacterium]|nr:hypothetical protein [Desulfobacterales bacterium]
MTSKANEKILQEIQDRLAKSIEDDQKNKELALEDLEFVGIEDSQWPDDVKAMRLADGRPCLTINKMPAFIDQVVGDQRMNRPAIKVVPVDSKGDIEVARILSGWIKHVEQVSKSDIAIDHGFEHAVTCGYGALRVVTKYINDTSKDQDAFIEKVENALAIYWGKHLEYDCSDANYCIIVTDLDRDEFKAKYKKEPVEFNTANSQYVEGWSTKETVRVAEYFVKEYTEKKIYFLEDGRSVYELEKDDVKESSRIVRSYKVMRYLVSGNDVLEKNEWVGKKYIPIIPIWGKEINVGGKKRIRGLIRHAKDSQRMFNYWNSLDTEVAALQPKSPFLVTPKQISGHESQWKESHRKNFPYLLVNFDEKAPGWPKRESPPQASSAMIERIQSTDQEMRDTIGMQKASLGMQSNERSGKAIVERKKEGDVGTFAFIDNLSRSIEQLGRVLVDVAPGILDTERIIRLGLDDGKQEFVKINEEVETEGDAANQILNDMSIGIFDIIVSVGPSFDTQRTEARQSMSEFIQYYPNAAPLIGDLYAKAMDWPGAEDVSERLEFLLPLEVKKEKALKDAKQNGETPPLPSEPPPPPDQMLKIQERELKLQEGQLKLQEGQIKLEESKVELEQEKVKLEQEQAKLIQIQQDIKTKTVENVEEIDNGRRDS